MASICARTASPCASRCAASLRRGGYSANYLEQLKADKKLAAIFEEPKTTNSTRNPSTGRLAVEIFLPFKPVKK